MFFLSLFSHLLIHDFHFHGFTKSSHQGPAFPHAVWTSVPPGIIVGLFSHVSTCFHMSKAVHLSNVIELCIAMQELELHTLYAYRRLILPFSRLMFFFLNTFSCFCCFYLIALHIHDESLDGSCHAGNADSSGSLPATEGWFREGCPWAATIKLWWNMVEHLRMFWSNVLVGVRCCNRSMSSIDFDSIWWTKLG